MGRTRFVRSIKAKGTAALVASCLAGLVAAPPASAGTVDQSHAAPPGTPAITDTDVAGGDPAAQTFTAGRSGLLDQVDLWVTREIVSCTADLIVQIRTVTPEGGPSQDVLATATIAAASVAVDTNPPDAPYSAFFASPAAVTAGTQYALVLSVAADAPPDCYDFWGDFGNPYPGGMAFGTNSAEFDNPTPTVDRHFRTYVADPAPPTVDCQGTTVPATNGTEGDDNLVGTLDPDAIFGLGGNDELDGVDGNDCLDAGDGDDRASGGADNDLVKGGDGRDRVRGVGGKDRLKGQGGVDRVNGGEGSDRLSGGPGADKMRGGAAKDRYKGNAGDDDINAVDAKRDRVNCGGGDDKAVVDPVDRVSANCETVREVEKED